MIRTFFLSIGIHLNLTGPDVKYIINVIYQELQTGQIKTHVEQHIIIIHRSNYVNTCTCKMVKTKTN